MKVDVLTSGYVSMDHIIKIATPAKVGFTSLVTNKSNSKIFYGGCSVNIAYALCRLGMKAMPVLRVGGDYESNGFKKFLEEGNVPQDGITQIAEEATSVCYLLQDNNNDHITIFYPGPMKLAGSELMFGEGSLAYIKTIKAKKVSIVIGGHSMEKSGMLAKVEGYFKETGAETMVIRGVEPDPSFETVLRGRNEMLEFEPDLIVGLGGGSAMDAAKAMWIFYEHPELTQMEDILPPNEFPKLRGKARMCCIPSTSGTASEVSRSIVISDNEKGLKHGVGNMEMMPDIAICDPEVTMSMPAKITAETGMDALTHALEALASNRANYLSDILASQAAQDIMETLPTAYANGNDIKARETMVQASMVAGIAFTNVSLGIVHSMAHTIGGIFHVSHGLADAIILPYIIRYNEQNETAKEVYAKFAKRIGAENLHEAVEALNEKLNIPKCFKEIIPDEEKYMAKLDEMAPLAKADGCTKTNPVIPEIDEFKELFIKVYRGE